MLRIVCITTLLTICASTHAQNEPIWDSPFRAQFSYLKGDSKLKLGSGSAQISDTMMETIISHNFTENVFVEAGYTLSKNKLLTTNSTVDLEFVDSNESIMLGVGYLLPKSEKLGEFWGFGYQTVHSNTEEDRDSDVINLLSQKNTSQRFGEITFQYWTSENGNLVSIDGVHVWFLQPGLGFGLQWSFSGTTLDNVGIGEEEDTASKSAGLVFVFRPEAL